MALVSVLLVAVKRSGRLRARSAKTARAYVQRRPLVASLLAERPLCERCLVARSVDVHEVKSRARGGSILDVGNLRCLCRFCHDLITGEPALAEAEGWSVPSWWQPADLSEPGRSWEDSA